MTSKPKVKILELSQAHQKIKRIAYQIFENNFEETEIIIAGIDGEGYIFAQHIYENLINISSIKVYLAKVSFDKTADIQPDITLACEVGTFKNKVVVLADDVLNTGRTLAYCLRPFLHIQLKKLQVAVLVDRNHPTYPILADYVGYSLSTTLTEHVQVKLNSDQDAGVYLY
jgi:pyrimidine operon attenuation protein / uracil phosphoribosyltransferase